MTIHQLIEQLHALAVENPTATVVTGADEEPVDKVIYVAENNTIVIDP